MLPRKIRSMNVFNALKHSEIVETVLTEISQRQKQLGVMKLNGYADVEALTAAQSHLVEVKKQVRQKRIMFTFPVEAMLVAK